MAGLFPQDAIEKRAHPDDGISEWNRRVVPGGNDQPGVPIPNFMPPDMTLMDEFIASGPGRHRREGQQINYRKRSRGRADARDN